MTWIASWCITRHETFGNSISANLVSINPARSGASGSYSATMRVPPQRLDRKSTRLNSSHLGISYAVFCRAMHPFPTRRSSDLVIQIGEVERFIGERLNDLDRILVHHPP